MDCGPGVYGGTSGALYAGSSAVELFAAGGVGSGGGADDEGVVEEEAMCPYLCIQRLCSRREVLKPSNSEARLGMSRRRSWYADSDDGGLGGVFDAIFVSYEPVDESQSCRERHIEKAATSFCKAERHVMKRIGKQRGKPFLSGTRISCDITCDQQRHLLSGMSPLNQFCYFRSFETPLRRVFVFSCQQGYRYSFTQVLFDTGK